MHFELTHPTTALHCKFATASLSFSCTVWLEVTSACEKSSESRTKTQTLVTATPAYVNCQTQSLPKIRRIPISKKVEMHNFWFFPFNISYGQSHKMWTTGLWMKTSTTRDCVWVEPTSNYLLLQHHELYHLKQVTPIIQLTNFKQAYKVLKIELPFYHQITPIIFYIKPAILMHFICA